MRSPLERTEHRSHRRPPEWSSCADGPPAFPVPATVHFVEACADQNGSLRPYGEGAGFVTTGAMYGPWRPAT